MLPQLGGHVPLQPEAQVLLKPGIQLSNLFQANSAQKSDFLGRHLSLKCIYGGFMCTDDLVLAIPELWLISYFYKT